MAAPRRKSSWRKAFGPDEVIQRVRPEPTGEFLNNPHKGTTTFQRFNGDPLYPDMKWSDCIAPTSFKAFRGDWRKLHNGRYPDTRLAYCRWVWSVIEPAKGQFRWDLIEAALDSAAQRGQTLQARLQPTAGGAPYPEWFWATGAPRWPEQPHHPDFNCPQYVKHWTDLIRAFGKRFDGHPTLESFDIAYAGGCGETGGNATPATAERLADAYLNALPATQLLAMLGTHGCAYAAARRDNLGWRADCFGDVHTGGAGVVPDHLCWNHMRDLYPKEVALCGVQDAWKHAPITFETCWTVPYWHERGWDLDWILEQGLAYHASVFMPKSVWIPEDWAEKIEAFNQRLGYWFWLHQMTLPLEARPGARMKIEVTIENKGVAPIYRPYRFALRFRQGDRDVVVPFREDVRRWLPGHSYFAEQLTLPRSLQPGVAHVSCGLVDASGAPCVRLAIRDVEEGPWHPLTCLDVL